MVQTQEEPDDHVLRLLYGGGICGNVEGTV